MPRLKRNIKQRRGYGDGHIEHLWYGHAWGPLGKNFGDPEENELIGGWLLLSWYSEAQLEAMRTAWLDLREQVIAKYQKKWGPGAMPWAYFVFEAKRPELISLTQKDLSSLKHNTLETDMLKLCKKGATCDKTKECSLREYCKQAEAKAAFGIHLSIINKETVDGKRPNPYCHGL